MRKAKVAETIKTHFMMKSVSTEIVPFIR